MEYTVDQLLKIIESYKRMIEHSGEKYPTVVLDDIHASTKFVLNRAKGEYKDAV